MEYLLSHFFAKEGTIDVGEQFYRDLFFPFDRIIRLCPDHTTRSLVCVSLQIDRAQFNNNIRSCNTWRNSLETTALKLELAGRQSSPYTPGLQTAMRVL